MPRHEEGDKPHEKERKLSIKAQQKKEGEQLATPHGDFSCRQAAMKNYYNKGMSWENAWEEASNSGQL